MRESQPMQPTLYLYICFVFCVNPDNQIEFVTLMCIRVEETPIFISEVIENDFGLLESTIPKNFFPSLPCLLNGSLKKFFQREDDSLFAPS